MKWQPSDDDQKDENRAGPERESNQIFAARQRVGAAAWDWLRAEYATDNDLATALSCCSESELAEIRDCCRQAVEVRAEIDTLLDSHVHIDVVREQDRQFMAQVRNLAATVRERVLTALSVASPDIDVDRVAHTVGRELAAVVRNIEAEVVT